MSKTFKIAAAATAVLLLTAGVACAQPQGGQGRGGNMMDRYDTDKDGKISLSEYEAGRMANFGRMDTDSNGSISFAELDAMAAQRPQMANRITAMKAADTNGDSAISQDEYKAMADADFKKQDANGDGFLTADEMMPPRQ